MFRIALKPVKTSIALFLTAFFPALSQADFSPSEVVLVCNKRTSESCALASYYAAQRNVPISNTIQLETRTEEIISREEYNQHIFLPIKKELSERGLLSKALVLITFYGIPLSISESTPPPQMESLKLQLASRSRELTAKATADLKKLRMIGGKTNGEAIELNSLTTEKLASLINDAKSALISARSDAKVLEGLMQTVVDLIGLKGIFAGNQSLNKDATDKFSNEIKSRETALQEVATPSNSTEIDKYLVIQKDLYGTLGTIKIASQLADSLFSTDSGASVDNELSLLKVQPGGAPLTNRINSPLFVEDISSNESPKGSILTAIQGMMLVSRLDASNPELVKTIIKDTIETEKNQSLKGNFLIDSRGLPWTQSDAYADWDKNLVKLARKIETGSRFDIEFDGNEELASETSKVALYTGWYSLRKYENLYKFTKGSIGYHIASEEAVSLRDSSERGWCKNFLDHGVVATLGAVSEPFLDSFPKPYDFFKLLLSGKYQLVEVYYLTSRYLSWKMVLVGDPLYKPISEKTARDEFDYDTEDFNELPVAPSVLMRN